MTTALRSERLRAGLLGAFILAGILALAVTAPPQVTAAGILVIALGVVFRRWLTGPRGLLAVLVLTVMWIPAGRFALVGSSAALPWRLVVLGMLVLLFLSLALDRSARWRPSPFLVPVLAFPTVGLLSVLANLHALGELGQVGAAVLTTVQAFLTVGIFVVARQLCTSSWIADWLCRLLVLAALVVALSVAVEAVTGTNVFLLLDRVLPLQLLADAPVVTRAGTTRALGSANHPIALSVVLAMLLPVAVFLSRYSPWPRSPEARRVLYLGTAVALVLAGLLTGSRTLVVMLVVMAALVFFTHWTLFVRLLLGAAPFGLVAVLLIPGVVLGLVRSFLDPQELIASQYSSPGWRGSGRLADLGPSLVEAQDALVLGTGVGSRIIDGPDTNALILDNQYLSTLLESGLVGLLAMAVMLVLPAVVMVRHTRDARLPSAERHLALALACAFGGYAASAFFFDAFAFQQTFMLFLLLLAVGSWLVTSARARRTPAAADAGQPEEIVGSEPGL
ncbi:hypothetical protein O2W18_01015 [Modestobacter sp. VKM Ac-2983]|uniref:O-antigen ligase family protein n=1 Tax=Modestobacter sp. VKM Ac-2983 TaxID=3004137 RepID=UPI0022ABC290|nr:hypothetical protein [Modestobacter sp. VKM Ac-2983]MCZ2803680.1 hypothetical protein [Modestobacter sp. VKM Ac-2983]